MPTVTVEDEKSFEVESGTKLVLAIEDAGIDIMHRCGGDARCTTCRVQVLAGEPGPMDELEQARLAREASLAADIRLACQVRVESDLTSSRAWACLLPESMPGLAPPIDAHAEPRSRPGSSSGLAPSVRVRPARSPFLSNPGIQISPHEAMAHRAATPAMGAVSGRAP